MSNKENLKVPFTDLSAEELQKKAVELQEVEKSLQENEKAFLKKDKDLDDLLKKNLEMAGNLAERKAKLDKREADISKKEAAPKSSQLQPGLEFEFEGENYKFLDSAPKKINVDGKGYSQQEISENEDLLTALIGGNSGLIIKN